MKMKQHFILGIFTLTFFIFSLACSSGDPQKHADTEVSAENLIMADYAIDGMVCAMGCAKTIQDEVSNMEGVTLCSVDFESGKAHVEFDQSMLTEDDIIRVIEGMAEGQYQVHEWVDKEDNLSEVEEEETDESAEVETGSETEGSITEVRLPSFEIPNLFALLFNQL